ncbi:MAG: hypothetical protein BGN92_09805 [Sphingobacteriales bacterium 41-5]|nr:MAG: hypothetical protein BGN92_09805 [Sphingobacteriales bacterium 41-5]
MKILSFNENQYNRYLADANKTATQAQEFINLFQAICPLKFDSSLLVDAMHSTDATATTEAIKKQIEAQLQSANINIQAITDAAVNDSINRFWQLRNQAEIADPTVLSQLVVTNNVVSLPADFKEKAKAQFSHILRSPAAIALHEKQLKMIAAMNDFFASCPGLDTGQWGNTFTMPGYSGRNEVVANTNFDYERFSKVD